MPNNDPNVNMALAMFAVWFLDKIRVPVYNFIKDRLALINKRESVEVQAFEGKSKAEEKQQQLHVEAQEFLTKIAHKHFEELQTENVTLQDQLKNYIISLEQMKEELSRYRQERDRYTQKLNDQAGDMERLRAEFDLVSNANNLNKQKLELAEENVQMLNIKSEKLDSQVASMKRELERMETIINREQTNNNLLSESLRETQELLGEAKRKLEEEKDLSQKLQVIIDELRQYIYSNGLKYPDVRRSIIVTNSNSDTIKASSDTLFADKGDTEIPTPPPSSVPETKPKTDEITKPDSPNNDS